MTTAALGDDMPMPTPMVSKDHPVDWWFVFKFNAAAFPACAGPARQCPFGGTVQPYPSFGQQFVFASSDEKTLTKGSDCAGDSTSDPIGATFAQVYNGSSFYVIWNDQFYDDPGIAGCTNSCGAPWGHSKGMLAWNSDGEGFVLQVTTPSWPASGSKSAPRRTDGNTLGCGKNNNVKFSQHFFALKLSKSDLLIVLHALANASVVTDPGDPQIVNNGGPADVQDAVQNLGRKSPSVTATHETLSSGVELIAKPSKLAVPPWQLVSALLGGIPLRTATWWAAPKIYSSDRNSKIKCWPADLRTPGSVEVATRGQWEGKPFALTGGPSSNNNHAKFGVSTSGSAHYAIFGDMNQQGTIAPGDRPCTSSQNGRGGLFYVLKDDVMANGLATLMTGDTAPTDAP
jgi:hypothetical protein